MAFLPRLTDVGILNNPKWYSQNIFYQAGYGMPNCTCYAWGRFWEESNTDLTSLDHKPTDLPTGDGGQWWSQNQQSGAYPAGQVPALGAVICFQDNNGGAGHVAVVEEIDSNGNLRTSNSAWGGTYFWIDTVNASSGYNWDHYTFQGFIYNPYIDQPVTGKKKFPWVLYARKLREKRNGGIL